MQQRRRRLSRRFRDRVEEVRTELVLECRECFNRYWQCFAQGNEAWHCDNNCGSCQNFSRNCRPNSNCSGSQVPEALVRDEFHGRRGLVRYGFHERGRRWRWNCQTGNNDLP